MNIPRDTFPGTFSLVTAPAEEPVTLAEAKLHLRVDFSDDDDLITGLIVAARRRCEGHNDQAFVTQTWDYKLEAFPYVTNDDKLWRRVQNAVIVPKAPLVSVSSLTYVAWDGTTQTLTEGTDFLSRTGSPGAVYPFPVTRVWPYTRYQFDAVTLRAVFGYGDASAVPQTIKQAILLLVGHWYWNREAVDDSGSKEVPLAVGYLLAAESWGSRP